MRGPLSLALVAGAFGQDLFLAMRPGNGTVEASSPVGDFPNSPLSDFLNANGCGNCHHCANPIEGPSSIRQSQHQQMAAACRAVGCSTEELATVIGVAMLESDDSCHTDTSKGTDRGDSNFSPFNMNADMLQHVGCNMQCAQSLGQHCGSYDINKAVFYLVTALRGTNGIGNTCDFFNFHRGGVTGWQECLSVKGHNCACDCSWDCKGYKDAAADAAKTILGHQQYLSSGERVCMQNY